MIEMNAGTVARFPIGSAVKPSGYATESARLYWLGLGDEPRKTRAREWYHAAQAKRGTVTAHQPSKHTSAGLEVTWSDGTISRCLDYMVEPVDAGAIQADPRD